MRRRVQRWGNSLAVRIPAAIAEACAVSEGSEVSVRQEGSEIVLTPEPERKRYLLGELVRGITKRNCQDAVDWRGPVGKESW
jgi:antitoxin MazE